MEGQQFYSTDFESALRGGVVFPEWLKNREKTGAGQWRNGLRGPGIESWRGGRERREVGFMQAVGFCIKPTSRAELCARTFSREYRPLENEKWHLGAENRRAGA